MHDKCDEESIYCSMFPFETQHFEEYSVNASNYLMAS